MDKANDAGVGVLVRASRTSRKPTVRDVLRSAQAIATVGPALEANIDRLEVERRTPLHESGHDVLVRRSRGGRTEVGIPNPLAPTGTDQDILLSEIGTAWDRLEREISAAHRATPPTVSQQFYVSFLTDYHAWTAFRADHASDRFSWTVTMRQAEQHRQKLEQWRTTFQALGGHPAGTPTQPVPPGMLEDAAAALGPGGVTRAAEAASSAMTAVAVVAVAAVIAVVVYEGSSIAKRVT